MCFIYCISDYLLWLFLRNYILHSVEWEMTVNGELVGKWKEALTFCCEAVYERLPEESEENHE